MSAIVQQTAVVTGTNLGPSGSINLSLTGTHAGNMLVLSVAYIDDSALTSQCGTVADGVNTWNAASVGGDSEKTFNHQQSSIYSAYNIAGGNVTVNVPNNGVSTSMYLAAVLYEVSFVLTAAANDVNGNANDGQNSTNPISCIGLPLAVAGEIVFATFAVNDNTNTGPVTPTGWANDGLNMGNYPAYGFTHFFATGTSALSPSFGALSVADNWTLAMASYKPKVQATVPLGGFGHIEYHWRSA